jgi:glycosyltransferase involved in cell wall biosynthesis
MELSSSVPAVSIVVPLYNKAAYILRCLKSIQDQCFSDFEVIVVDDGSTDGSGAIAAGFCDPRFKIVTQENRGSGAARNRGIREARAQLIAFLDADDTWEVQFLEAIAGLAMQYPEAGLLATGYRRCLGTGLDKLVTLRDRSADHTLTIENYLRIAREGDVVTSSSVGVRARVLAEAGGFLAGEPFGEDQELWVRLSLHAPIAYDTRILAVYHSEASNRMCRALDSKKVLHPAIRCLRELLEQGNVSEDRRQDLLFYIDWLSFSYVVSMLYNCGRSEIEGALRSVTFFTFRFRIAAFLLRISLGAVSPRVLAAIKLKPAALLSTWRQVAAVDRFSAWVEGLLGRSVRICVVPTPCPPPGFQTANLTPSQPKQSSSAR